MGGHATSRASASEDVTELGGVPVDIWQYLACGQRQNWTKLLATAWAAAEARMDAQRVVKAAERNGPRRHCRALPLSRAGPARLKMRGITKPYALGVELRRSDGTLPGTEQIAARRRKPVMLELAVGYCAAGKCTRTLGS